MKLQGNFYKLQEAKKLITGIVKKEHNIKLGSRERYHETDVIIMSI